MNLHRGCPGCGHSVRRRAEHRKLPHGEVRQVKSADLLPCAIIKRNARKIGLEGSYEVVVQQTASLMGMCDSRQSLGTIHETTVRTLARASVTSRQPSSQPRSHMPSRRASTSSSATQ